MQVVHNLTFYALLHYGTLLFRQVSGAEKCDILNVGKAAISDFVPTMFVPKENGIKTCLAENNKRKVPFLNPIHFVLFQFILRSVVVKSAGIIK